MWTVRVHAKYTVVRVICATKLVVATHHLMQIDENRSIIDDDYEAHEKSIGTHSTRETASFGQHNIDDE